MKNIKTFENFKLSSADEYIKSVLLKFGLEYEENVYDSAGNLCIKAEFDDDKYGIFYISASHPDKEFATYNIEFLVNDRLEGIYSTKTDLANYIFEMIEELR